MDKIKKLFDDVRAWALRHKKALIITASITLPLVLFHVWLSLTNPYARWNIVQQPYVTTVQDGQISYHKNFDLKVYSGRLAQALGYYKSGFLILQNTYFGSAPAKSNTPDGIIADIHQLRFNPSKPYLISGDSFSVLYPRNLGVFYNALLDPHTALNQTDWENRQRIYLQSALYALDAFSYGNTLATTIVPVGPQSAVLTEVHPGSVPSDSLYGLLYALHAMQDPTNPDTPYKLETVDAAKQITRDRHDDLHQLLHAYLAQVQDRQTGLIKRDAKLSGARDGVTRQSSFYDNVILWKTLQLAGALGIADEPPAILDSLHGKILATYWDNNQGHFKDDASQKTNNYSSDWLIALPAGFLNPQDSGDLPYLTRSVDFIHAHHIAEPFPIKYQATSTANSDVPWAVRTFVPNYGGDTIWSYWGAQYMTLLGQLGHTTNRPDYLAELQQDITTYQQKMVQSHGFPETYTPDGQFLQNAVYKSIRQTGWVVEFEEAVWQSKEKTTTK